MLYLGIDLGTSGMKIIVINEKGEIKIEGKRWSAKSASGTGIEKGSECLIEKIEGVTCVVRKVQ